MKGTAPPSPVSAHVPWILRGGPFTFRGGRSTPPTVVRLATVIHVLEQYLPLSAGFVHGQLHRSRHRAVVLSRLLPENLATFPHEPVRHLPAMIEHLPERARQRARNVAVLAHARAAGADLAHAHFGYALPDVAVLARRRGLPIVTSLHGHDVTAWPAEAPWVLPALAPLMSAAVVPSNFLAGVVAHLGIPEDRIHVIPSGIDTELFTPTPLPPRPTSRGTSAAVAVFVGRLVEKKGIDVLLEAWPSVRAAVPGATLRILGSGPLESSVARAAAPSASGIELLVPDASHRGEQVRDLLRVATVVATPSKTAPDGDSESLLLVNLEAQACGRAVVTTRHGGIPEFVADGESALLVPEADAAALARALIAVLSDVELAARLGAAGPRIAARFDARSMAARVDDLYDALLEDRARSTRRHRGGAVASS